MLHPSVSFSQPALPGFGAGKGAGTRNGHSTSFRVLPNRGGYLAIWS